MKQQKLEYTKSNRKYSPEYDLGRVLQQTQQKKLQLGSLRHQNSITDSSKRPSSAIKGSIISTTTIKKSSANFSTSEYHNVGKSHLQKKRGSEMSHNSTNSKQSPDVRSSQLRGSIQKSTKGHYESVISQSNNHVTSLKTSQLYTQVHKKMTTKKSRNMSSQGGTMNKTQTEECKIESNYQTLNSPQLLEPDSGQFIVK